MASIPELNDFARAISLPLDCFPPQILQIRNILAENLDLESFVGEMA